MAECKVAGFCRGVSPGGGLCETSPKQLPSKELQRREVQLRETLSSICSRAVGMSVGDKGGGGGAAGGENEIAQCGYETGHPQLCFESQAHIEPRIRTQTGPD